MIAWLRRAYCGLRGHDDVMRFEFNSLSVQCVSCERKTEGITIDGPKPRQTQRATRYVLRRVA